MYSSNELLGFIYNNNTYYYHKNMFDDIIGIYDSNYNEIVTYEYDSWGVIKNITDNSNINIGIINPFRYKSYYYDEETELYYLNSRYYNPIIGRFINGDSIISSSNKINGYNIFGYCNNNPVINIDKTGKSFFSIIMKHFKKVLKKIEEERVKKYGSAPSYRNITYGEPNCYGYALNLNIAVQPGDYGGRIPKDYSNVYDVGKSIEKDLKAMGRTIRVIKGPKAKINKNEYRIALRVGTKPLVNQMTGKKFYDYHFMIQTRNGYWAEKHGWRLTVLHNEKQGLNPNNISWDIDEKHKGYYDSDIIYYAIGE